LPDLAKPYIISRLNQVDLKRALCSLLCFLGVGLVSSISYLNSSARHIFPTVLILIISAYVAGQTTSFNQPENPTPNPVDRRIERAKALAAAHQLQAAANELENVRASVNDIAIRNGTSLMLLGIYLEEGNYGRAQSLLEDSFQIRAAQKDDSIRTYFAMAGQVINGVRSHLARYRSFGLNTAEAGLPPEAVTDLDRVRGLLERLIAQARIITKEDGRLYDGLALQEDVLGIRLSVPRDVNDRDKWQTEYVAAREQLAASQVQVASLGRPPALAAVAAKLPNPFASPTPAQTDPAGKKDGAPASGSTTPAAGSTTTAAPVAQPQPEAAEPKLVTAGTLSGRETKRVTPQYPAQAKTNGVAGVVRVFAIVDEKGKVWVTGSEGPTLLRSAAEEAARNWLFPPSVFAGKPVRIAGYIDFEFKL
jgi:TonB family protein